MFSENMNLCTFAFCVKVHLYNFYFMKTQILQAFDLLPVIIFLCRVLGVKA